MGDRLESGARAVILQRIRAALDPPARRVPVTRSYRTSLPAEINLVEHFANRVSDYRALVSHSSLRDLPGVVARVLAGRGARHAVIPPGLPMEWTEGLPLELIGDDPPLTKAQLDDVDAVITGCAIAVAETGTIVLDAGSAQGRRVLTLLPDTHVCVVREHQIVGDVSEALGRLDGRRPLTWISGPSATSDIELQRIEGVHGPRKLDVIIVG